MKITIFRDVTLCSMVERYQRFILKTVGILQNVVVSHPKTTIFEQLLD